MKGLVMATGEDTHTVRGPKAFAELVKREQNSATIHLNQPNFVPGLLQVREYATAMISGTTGLSPDSPQVAERVDRRMDRATAFKKRLREGSSKVTAVLDEGTLRRVVGGREAMRQQLDHLRAIAGDVELAIIPFDQGAYPGLTGSFEVHEDADGDAVVFFETANDDELTTDQDKAARLRGVVDEMLTSAVTGPDAKTLLETISKSL